MVSLQFMQFLLSFNNTSFGINMDVFVAIVTFYSRMLRNLKYLTVLCSFILDNVGILAGIKTFGFCK